MRYRVKRVEKGKDFEEFYITDNEDGDYGDIIVDYIGGKLCAIGPLQGLGYEGVKGIQVLRSLFRTSELIRSSKYVLAIWATEQEYGIRNVLEACGFRKVAVILNTKTSNDLYIYLKRKNPSRKKKFVGRKFLSHIAHCCGAAFVTSERSMGYAVDENYSAIFAYGKKQKFMKNFIKVTKDIWLGVNMEGYEYTYSNWIKQYPSGKKLKPVNINAYT